MRGSKTGINGNKRGCCKTARLNAVSRQHTRRNAAIGRSGPAFITIRRGKPRTHGKAVCRINSGKPSGKVPRSISGVERSHPAFEDDFELCSKSLKAPYAAALIKNRQITGTDFFTPKQYKKTCVLFSTQVLEQISFISQR